MSEGPKRVVSKRVVLADVPPVQKPERGYVRMFLRNEKPERGYVWMFPRNENRNKGTFAKTTLLRNRPLISQWLKAWIYYEIRVNIPFSLENFILACKLPSRPWEFPRKKFLVIARLNFSFSTDNFILAWKCHDSQAFLLHFQRKLEWKNESW